MIDLRGESRSLSFSYLLLAGALLVFSIYLIIVGVASKILVTVIILLFLLIAGISASVGLGFKRKNNLMKWAFIITAIIFVFILILYVAEATQDPNAEATTSLSIFTLIGYPLSLVVLFASLIMFIVSFFMNPPEEIPGVVISQ